MKVLVEIYIEATTVVQSQQFKYLIHGSTNYPVTLQKQLFDVPDQYHYTNDGYTHAYINYWIQQFLAQRQFSQL